MNVALRKYWHLALVAVSPADLLNQSNTGDWQGVMVVMTIQ